MIFFGSNHPRHNIVSSYVWKGVRPAGPVTNPSWKSPGQTFKTWKIKPVQIHRSDARRYNAITIDRVSEGKTQKSTVNGQRDNSQRYGLNSRMIGTLQECWQMFILCQHFYSFSQRVPRVLKLWDVLLPKTVWSVAVLNETQSYR